MGTLYCKTTNQQIPLRMRCLFGRDATCDVRVDDPKVSHEHASLRWRDGAWELRDLGSVNGTLMGSRRLKSGERALLEAGATFSLSTSGEVFELRDASAPFAAALHRSTGAVHVATGGILVLPSEEQPRVTLFATSDGEWQVEIEKEVRPATNGEIVELGANAYVLEVPVMAASTIRTGETAPMLESIRLKFEVAPDEESVEITMFVGAKATTLPARRYHYLLVTLARAWIEDAGTPSSVRGFRDRDELCDKLDMDVMKLNVEIYRLRKQFAEMGIQGAAGLIERRPGTYEVRIGVPDVEVVLA
jgi:pSer/pThr/pTyr-binding forkhead associated (FHA) protein